MYLMHMMLRGPRPWPSCSPLKSGRPMRREPVTASRLPFAGRGGGRCRQVAETALRCASFRMLLGDYTPDPRTGRMIRRLL
jgi:hypothetical protein